MSNPTHTEIVKAVAKWINSVVGPSTPFGAVAFAADQNAPRPPTTSVSIRVGASTRIGEDYVSPPDEFGVSDIDGVRERVVYLQALGDGALDVLEALRDSLQTFAVRDALCADGLVHVTDEVIQNLTGLIDQTMVPRGAFDVRFRLGNVVKDSGSGVIETAEIRGTVSGSDVDVDVSAA